MLGFSALSNRSLAGPTFGLSLSLSASESFATSESIAKSIGKNISESWATAEAKAVSFLKAVSESWNNAESLGNAVAKAFAEAWGTVDLPNERLAGLNPGESVSIAESFSRVVAYHIALSDGWSQADALAKAYGLNRAEAVTFFEEFVRKANGIISDMILMDTPLTLDNFTNALDSGHAPGYENFRDFIQGNYDYTNALFRMILLSTRNDRAALSALSATVDVPDIFDGGEATITNATTGVTVTFNRTFHVAPTDINVTLKGGASLNLNPEYSSVTTTDMNVKLRDASNALATGTISWSIRGR